MKIQYNRNRYYDHYTGRWLTHDPLGITSNAQKPNVFGPSIQYREGLSLYGYVHSNPVAKSDSFGLWDCWTDEWGIEHCEPTDPTDPMPPERSYPSPECLARFDLWRVCDWYDYKTCCNVGVKRYNDDAKQECREEAQDFMYLYEMGIRDYWRIGREYTWCYEYQQYIMGEDHKFPWKFADLGWKFFTLAKGYTPGITHDNFVGVFHVCNRILSRRMRKLRKDFPDKSDATLDPYSLGIPFTNRFWGSPCVRPGRKAQDWFGNP